MKNNRMKPLALAAMLACIAPLHMAAHAQVSSQALPNGATVANGSANITQYSNGLGISVTPGTIINWQGFSIGANRAVQFDQINASSAVLNRVTGTQASEIMGTLQSNGRVFLLNPNGIFFGAGSRVDVAGLIASTLNMSDAEFLAGNYRFTCFNTITCEAGVDLSKPYNNRVILEDGSQITTRTAGAGGQVWLIARDKIVSEKGSKIDAPSGQVIAAAAREVTITSPALGQMSFTLGGPVGSQIDLEGDIDVARGAAGFFADHVRLAGKVWARSDAGAAGQILARAASELSVDGDARLDVSGNGAADAGAVRLGATRRVTIATSTEIAADGGSAGGQGGLIELEAAEVFLPVVLGYGAESPVQIHARGSDTTGLTLARFGRVDVKETGNFEYTTINGPVWTATGSANNVRADYSSSTFTNDSVSISNGVNIAALAAAGDGQTLLVTLDNANNREFHYSGSGGQSSGTDVTTVGQVYQIRLLDAQGQLVATRALSSASDSVSGENGSPVMPVRTYAAVGLSKGGWVIRERGDDQRIHVVSAQASITTVLEVSETATLRAMLSGGFIVEDIVNGTTTRAIYTATGTHVTDAATVASLLAGENFTQALTPMQGLQNFDERRGWRVVGGAMQYFDRVDETVERSAPLPLATITSVQGAIGSSLIGGGITVVPTSNADYRQEVEYGTIDGASYAPLGTTIYHRQSSGQLIPRANSSLSNSVDTADLGNFLALGGGAIGYTRNTMHTTSTTTRTTAQPQTVTDRTTGDVSSSVSFNRVQRTLAATPPAAQQVAGTVFAPVLLANLPGRSNGVAEGGGGVLVPVDPGVPPTTPPTSGSDVGGGGDSYGVASRLELPLPPPLPGIRPPPPVVDSGSAPPAGLSVPAAVATGPSIDELEGGGAEFLDAARDVVRELLGSRGIAKFEAADGPRERAAVLTEARYAYTLGPELYAAVEFIGEPMRFALMGAMGELQVADRLNERDLSESLMKALTVTRESPGPDGSPGVPRTRLADTLKSLEKRLEEADSLAERNRVKALLMREMVIASRQEEGDTVDATGDVQVVTDSVKPVRITPAGDVIRE